MKIYKKCSCCGKIMFLMLGSDFGNEIELGWAFGSKDNIPHPDTNHEQDWEYLANFLTNLQTNHGEIYLSLKEADKRKIPQKYQTLLEPWIKSQEKTTED